MRRLLLLLIVLAGVFVGLVFVSEQGFWDYGPVVITREGEQKLVLRLNEARRVTEPGLDWIWPGLEKTETYPRRWLYLNSEPNLIQTSEGEQLVIDNYAIWRIADAKAFRSAFRGQVQLANDRIDRAVRDDVREVVGRYKLREVLDSKRDEVMREITASTREKLATVGVEIGDVRISRTDLPEQTLDSVYGRMRTERERLAKKNRAEGDQKARVIRAEAEAEARVIVANATRDSEIARGQGDAEATRIYAEAYNADPEFYGFVRSLEAYRKTIGEGTTLVLSPKSEFFQFFESSSGNSAR